MELFHFEVCNNNSNNYTPNLLLIYTTIKHGSVFVSTTDFTNFKQPEEHLRRKKMKYE